jgi:hypothetical protein
MTDDLADLAVVLRSEIARGRAQTAELLRRRDEGLERLRMLRQQFNAELARFRAVCAARSASMTASQEGLSGRATFE